MTPVHTPLRTLMNVLIGNAVVIVPLLVYASLFYVGHHFLFTWHYYHNHPDGTRRRITDGNWIATTFFPFVIVFWFMGTHDLGHKVRGMR